MLRYISRMLLAFLVVSAILPSCIAESQPKDTTVRLIVILASEPSVGSNTPQSEQDELARMSAIESYSGQELVPLGTSLINGAVTTVSLDNEQAATETLLASPDVAAVHREEIYHLCGTISADSAASTESIADQLVTPNAGSAGQGVKIAVISSGIDENHPMLDPTGYTAPSDWPVGDLRYTTNRVIAARMYQQPGTTPLEGETYASPGPADSGIGTYCAALAAGSSLTASYQGGSIDVSGRAPLAWLMNYRVFYPSVNDSEGTQASSIELVQAIDDAVNDDADIILATWTRPAALGITNDPVSLALQAAADAGVLVVTPAGDTGPTEGSTTSAGAGVDPALVVGAASGATAVRQNLLDVTAPTAVPDALRNVQTYPALFGQRLSLPTRELLMLDMESVEPDNSQACSTISTDLMGGVLLVERGGCTFAQKAQNAQAAGADALIIINSDDSPLEMSCSGDVCASISIPVFSVSQSDGQKLEAWATLYDNASLIIDPRARAVSVVKGVVPSFSSRGPAFANLPTPDLVAPGVELLSALPDEGYGLVSSTSAAAASAAGIAAEVWSAHSNWSLETLTAALQGGADQAFIEQNKEYLSAGTLAAGSGIAAASASESLAIISQPSSLAVPDLATGQQKTLTLTLRDLRDVGEAQAYAFSASADSALSITLPLAVTLAPGQETTASISISANSDVSPDDYDGQLFISDGSHLTTVPLWVNVRRSLPASDVLLIDNDFSHLESNPDYGQMVLQALQQTGYSITYWDADMYYGAEQTIPSFEELMTYDAVVWITGDNVNPDGYYVVPTPLTAQDQAVLARYLEAGGRMLAAGQNLAIASDINPSEDTTWGRADLLHTYLGAHTLGDAIAPDGSMTALGTAAGPLRGIEVWLQNQWSVDELGLGGLPDGSDQIMVKPLLTTAAPAATGDGHIGVIKGADPTLELPELELPYRTAYLGFGFEGLASSSPTSSTQLAKLILEWLLDTVSAECLDTIAEANEPLLLSCRASSSHATISSYRWQLTEGDNTQTVETTMPSITFTPLENGQPVRVMVQATDSLGHTAVDTCIISPQLGGSSQFSTSGGPARAGQTIELVLRLQHASSADVPATGEIVLPQGCEFVSGEGGDFATDRLEWSGILEQGEVHTLRMLVRVGASYPQGEPLDVLANVSMDGSAFQLTDTVTGEAKLFLPMIVRTDTLQ